MSIDRNHDVPPDPAPDDSDAAFDGPIDMSDLAEATEAPASLADISCWRLLTARVPLTLLVDLALPVERLATCTTRCSPRPPRWTGSPSSVGSAPSLRTTRPGSSGVGQHRSRQPR